MSTSVYRARWILPVTSPPIENGQLVVQDGRIVAIDQAGVPDPAAIDLGDSVVLPGFVNAHTHLELTHARGRIRFEGSFIRWIEALASLYGRERLDLQRPWEAIPDGLLESVRGGVTAAGDIGCGPAVFDFWSSFPLNLVGFLEVLGMGPRRQASHMQAVEQVVCWIEEQESAMPVRRSRNLCRTGISPHAPYSTDAPVYRKAIAFARRTGRPICTHLAETQEELQFLRDGTGDFADFLDARGLLDGSFEVPGCSPVEYMGRLGLLDLRPLLVHCNYVSDSDLDLIATSRASVAYCPRSHAYFGHAPHRWREMLARGINVCIGTDSLASNETLSVLDELRFLRRQDSTISDEQLLILGTLAGARALGIADQVGSLEAGKRADFAVLPLSRDECRDPMDALLCSTARIRNVFVGGRPSPGKPRG